MFCTRDEGPGGAGRWTGDGTGIGVRIRLEEVLLDKIWEAWVTDALPKAVESQGIFCG